MPYFDGMLKKSLLTLTGLFVLSSLALANIGETYKQSCARFGKPHHRSGETVWWFIDNDHSIGQTFEDSGARCDSIAYESWGGSFRPDQVLTLISSNVPSSEYFNEYPTGATGGRFWLSSKTLRTAYLCIRVGDSGRNPMELSVWTHARHLRVEAEESRAKAANAAASDSDQSPTTVDQAPTIEQLPSI